MNASSPETADDGGLAFRLFGFPVRVRWSFLFTTFVLAWLSGRQTPSGVATWIAVAFVGVLWHELGHAWAAAVFGASSEIELGGMGGLTYSGALVRTRWWKEVIVSLAGPAAGLALGGTVWVVARLGPPPTAAAKEIFEVALWVNVGWGLLNLLPILPYDGGSALRAALVAASPQRGEVTARLVSTVAGAVACAIALGAHMYWAAYLAGAAAVRSFGAVGDLRRQARLDAAWEALNGGRRAEAAAQVETLRGAGFEGGQQASVVELSIWLALQAGDLALARQKLAEMPAGYRTSQLTRATLEALDGEDPAGALREVDPALIAACWPPLVAGWLGKDAEARVDRLITERAASVLAPDLLHKLTASLFYGQELRAAMLVATRAFAAHRDPTAAYNVACCLARLEQPAEGLTWLERAVDAGFSDLDHLVADEDLATVRALPGFAAVATKLPAAVQPDKVGA